MITKPLVTIIIPTKNSETTIGKCLESVKNQTYPNVEIIVVDNYSRDKTKEIARRFGAKILAKGTERAAQINYGVKHAHGKYVYRIDSDFLIEPSLVDQAVAMCEDQACDAVVVHNISDPTVSFWSKVRKLERDCYKDDEVNVGARFLKREVFVSIEGFDEALIAAEDYDLHNKLLKRKFKIGRISANEIHIGEPRTLAEIVRKHYYYGTTIQKYVKKEPRRATRQFSPVRSSYLRHRSVFLRDPTLSLGFALYQMVRYTSTLIGLFAVTLDSIRI